ncbi:TonB-dependent receptor [Labilibacter sediminis]|nr:TonB-dependent receptor [Labilibacter sediminis]
MNKILVTLVLAFIGFSVSAQKAKVTGLVSDSETSEGIPYATVAIYPLGEDAPLNGTVTDMNGQFYLEKVRPGQYELVVSFMGYQPQRVQDVLVTQGQNKVSVGNVNLAPNNIAIDGVEVTAMKKTVTSKIDRKVYNASDFETAKGGTATDMLNKLPSVSVNPDGEVSVRGATDFMVYLNGKPTQMEPSMLLAQISSDAIENVEVITVPTAKYDAQGKGGIINITTKRSGVQGLSVSANGLLGGAPWGNLTDPISGYEQNDDRYGGGVNLIYMKDDLSLYGGFNYNKRNVNGMRSGDARLLQENGEYYHMVASGERPEWYENFSANAGFDYQINDKSNIAASYFYADRNEGRSAFYVYNNFYGDIDKGNKHDEEYIYNPNTDNRYGEFHTFNVDYNLKLNETSDIRLSALYEHSKLSRALDNRDYAFDNDNQEIGDIQEHFKQTDNTPLDGIRFSADYAKEFDNGGKLGLGLQPQWVSLNGGFQYDTLGVESGDWAAYEDLYNGVDLTRGVYAGYIDYSATTGKLDYMLGLRLEYTDQTLKVDNANYAEEIPKFSEPNEDNEYLTQQLDWFPTAHLKYHLDDNNSITAAASRRINRPAVKNMAPFLYRRHYEVYVIGDPSLEPEYINQAELSYDTRIGKQNINITGFYRGTENAVFRVNTTWPEENVLIRSYTNSGNTQALGVELNTNLTAGDFVKIFLGGSVYNYRVKADIFGYQEDNSSTNWSLKGNVNFNLTKELKLTTDFNVKSATVTAQGNNEMFYMANAALSYSPKKLEGWNFQLRGLDLLTSNITGLDTRAYDAGGNQIFYQDTEYVRNGPIVEVGVSYSFNMNGKKGKKTESTFGKKEF